MSRDATASTPIPPATPSPAPIPAPAPPPPLPWHEPIPTSGVPSLSALATVLAITTSRLVRGKRILVFAGLFALPTVLALILRLDSRLQERILVFELLPQAIIPLTALLFGSGLVQDDVEEQTLTYLLIRPVPRWAIYLVKVLGAVLATSVFAAPFIASVLAAIHFGEPDFDATAAAARFGVVSGLTALELLVYIAGFGFLGLVTRRALAVGVGYILVFEGFLANVPFMIRYATVMFYNRVLAVRWLGLPGRDWAVDPNVAPSAATCLQVLIGVAALFIALGAWVFSTREFRVKTPEGS